MSTVLTISHWVWDFDPAAFSVMGREIRWYGILFSLAFFQAYWFFRWQFSRRTLDPQLVDRYLYWVAGLAILGSRFVHFAFYETSRFFEQPWIVFNFNLGGFASHGATIGILLATVIYFRNYPHIPRWWFFDRLAVAAAFGGMLIRLGNFFNSEILGTVTDSRWGIVFARVGPQARHPVQLYESLAYAVIGILGVLLIRKQEKQGRCAGAGVVGIACFAMIFVLRFMLEFLKDSAPVAMGLTLGQLLSLPFIALAVGLYFWRNRQNSEDSGSSAAPLPHGSPAEKTKRK